MAGATVATWVKVRTKTGLTSRPISHKYEGGANYEKGQVITQSEFNEIKASRGEKVSTMKEKSDIKSKTRNDAASFEMALPKDLGNLMNASDKAHDFMVEVFRASRKGGAIGNFTGPASIEDALSSLDAKTAKELLGHGLIEKVVGKQAYRVHNDGLSKIYTTARDRTVEIGRRDRPYEFQKGTLGVTQKKSLEFINAIAGVERGDLPPEKIPALVSKLDSKSVRELSKKGIIGERNGKYTIYKETMSNVKELNYRAAVFRGEIIKKTSQKEDLRVVAIANNIDVNFTPIKPKTLLFF